MRACMSLTIALAGMLLVLTGCSAGAPPDTTDNPDTGDIVDPGTGDACADNGWYNDGECDTICLLPDPDCDPQPPDDGGEGVQPPPPDNGDAGDNGASETRSITSSEDGTLSLASGARLDVPVGAVPLNMDGTDGTMVFSIESGADPPSFNIAEGMILGDVFKYGPSGFNFARPVKVTLPVSDVQADGLTFATYDEGLDKWISVPGAIDADSGTVSANLQHFSFVGTSSFGSSAWENDRQFNWGTLRTGALTGSSMSFSVCIESFNLDFPDRDGAVFSPAGATLLAGALYPASIRLPQGGYSLNATAFSSSTGALLGNAPLGTFTITGDSGVNLSEGLFIDRSAWPTSSDLTPGRPSCLASPTSSVGTGEVQVSLSWQSNTDLDLIVTPPSGVDIFHGNEMGEDGGKLDRDHTCTSQKTGGIENSGKVENIVWQVGAPTGSYRVQVNYYGDCADVGSTSFDLRVIAGGLLQTFRGTLTEFSSTTVVEFPLGVN